MVMSISFDPNNKRTYLPTELYLPEWARDTEFFRDIAILLNYTEDSLKDFSNEKYAEIAQYYRDIAFKYKNTMLLSEDCLKAILKESGFGNILETFILPYEKLQMLVLYLPLFKALKGTDKGYNLLLSLMSKTYEIETWLDNPAELDEYTFELKIIAFLNIGFKSNIMKSFIELSRSYVYPILKNLVIEVVYNALSPAVYCLPKVQKDIKLKCFDELKQP